MSTSVLQFGTQNDLNPLKDSQEFAVSQIVVTLQDLLAALEEAAHPKLGMLRATAGHLTDYFGASPEEIRIESLRPGQAAFRRHLEAKKYKKNSSRSYSNYVGVLVKEARTLGWKEPEIEVPQCWQEILSAFPGGGRRDIIRSAISRGIKPEQLTEDGLNEICQLLADEGKACRHAKNILSEFRKTVRQAKLSDRFPELLIEVREAYRIRLKVWPEEPRKEVEALLRWKQADFAPGRPRQAQHSKATAKLLEDTLAYLFGYAVNIEKRTNIGTLAMLVTEELVTSYTAWSINVRQKNGRTFRGHLGLLYAALRHNPRYKDLDLGWFQPFLKSIPVDSESQAADRKAKRLLPYGTVQSIPSKIHTLRPVAALKGSRILAAAVRDELLMEWLLTLVWRQRNIRECKIGGSNPNLFKGLLPRSVSVARPQWAREIERNNPEEKFWQFRFTEDETKMGNRVHAMLPQRLIVLLEEYLGGHRSELLNGHDPQTLFVSNSGKALTQGGMYCHVSALTMRHIGKRVSPHVFRDIFAYEWLDHHPEDYLTLSKILWHTNIQTTLRVYGAQFNESNGVARLDDWLGERKAKAS